MYFADIKFLNRELVVTQALAFSRFKKQTPRPSSTAMEHGYRLQTKRKMSTRLDISGSTMYCDFQSWLDFET